MERSLGSDTARAASPTISATAGASSLACFHCPRCGTEALGALAATPTLRVAGCARCRGFWCATGQLEALIGIEPDPPFLAACRKGATLTSTACLACGADTLRRIRLGAADELHVDECPRCFGLWVDGGALPRLKERILTAPVPLAVPPPQARAPEAPADDARHRFDYDTLPVNGFALPVAFAVSGLAAATGLRGSIEGFVNMPLHELGHAAVAWFAGYFAVPVPFLTVMFSKHRNPLVVVTLAALLALAIRVGMRDRKQYLIALGALGLAVQACMTFLPSHAMSGGWFTFGGVLGEFVWSALLVVSFHYRLPDRTRWDFFRYLALAVGAFGLTSVMVRWFGAIPDLSFGIVEREGFHAQSDMMRMMEQYGWSPVALRSVYRSIGVVCVGVVAAHYAVFLRRALRQVRRA